MRVEVRFPLETDNEFPSSTTLCREGRTRTNGRLTGGLQTA